MRTDELISMLAADARPVEPRASLRRFRRALGLGVLATAAAMIVMFGIRPDIEAAARLPMFWLKLGFPAAVGAISCMMAHRLARPGVRLGVLPALLAVVFISVWTLGAAEVAGAAAAQRHDLVFGQSWRSCAFNIALLSIPLFAGTLWAMKGLAPTNLPAAGAAAGLLAGAASATIYALHCTEMQLPFIGAWYVLGMLMPAAAGAMAGRHLLHW